MRAPPASRWLRMRAFDQSRGQPQLATQPRFFAMHRALVGLMVVACQVQQAMEKQHLDFHFERMTALLCLPERCFERDHQIAGKALRNLCRGKRQHVGGFVFAAVFAVERTDRLVAGEQHAHLAVPVRSQQEPGAGSAQARGGADAQHGAASAPQQVRTRSSFDHFCFQLTPATTESRKMKEEGRGPPRPFGSIVPGRLLPVY